MVSFLHGNMATILRGKINELSHRIVAMEKFICDVTHVTPLSLTMY